MKKKIEKKKTKKKLTESENLILLLPNKEMERGACKKKKSF